MSGPDSSPLGLFSYFSDHTSEVLSYLWSHAWLSALPVLIGLVVAIPLGYSPAAIAGSIPR